MRCTTRCAGMTSCTRRGSECAATAAQRGSTACRSKTSSSTESSASCKSWAKCCAQASTARRSCGACTYPRQTEESDPWASRRCRTGWCRWRPSWCWSRSSRRTSSRARTGSGPGAARRWRWSGSGNWATQGANHVLDADIRELLRQHRTRQAAHAGGTAGRGPQGAQAGEVVAAGGGDGRRRGAPPGGGNAAGWSDLAAAVQHLPARAGPGVGQTRRSTWASWCGTRTTSWSCAATPGTAKRRKRRIEHVLGRLGLKLHPQKTRRVVLTGGQEGFDFLGCHLHKRMSGRLWEQKRLRRYYLHRWPSQRAMKRVRAAGAGADAAGGTLPPGCAKRHSRAEPSAARLGPVLPQRQRGQDVHSVDGYVVRRLQSLRIKRAGRHLRAGQAQRWDREYFEQLGLYRLRGTIRYPVPASWQQETA